MHETPEPRTVETPPAPRRLKFKISDAIILAVIVAVIVLLSVFLVGKLRLKHDVAQAQTVSDKVIADFQKRDGAAVRKLGSSKFQSTYSADVLTKQFKAVNVATSQTPKLDHTTVSSGSKGRTIFFIYKYSALKVPFYVRTALSEQAGAWRLTNISGNADESQLLVN